MDRRLELKVFGTVQGVNFRIHVSRQAKSLGLSGTVRNDPDGSVSITAEGPEDRLEELRDWAEDGPDVAHVTNVHEHWSDATDEFSGFTILQ